MTTKVSDTIIDSIIASCDGDAYGAVKALLLVNEQLEHELLQLQCARAKNPDLMRRHRQLH